MNIGCSRGATLWAKTIFGAGFRLAGVTATAPIISRASSGVMKQPEAVFTVACGISSNELYVIYLLYTTYNLINANSLA